MRRWRFGLFAWASFALLAQTNGMRGDAADGGRLYRSNCLVCHGPEGNMIEGIDLAHGKFRRASSDAAVIRIIQNGVAGTAMPPHSLTDLQCGNIVAYLRSLGVAAGGGSGDAARGRTVFETRGGCVGCHRVNGAGSRVGPDLSEIGLLRRAVELRESILEPDREVLLANRFVRVTTKDGETVMGRLLNQDSFTIQLLDSGERLRSFDRSDLRGASFMNRSPMPSYSDKLPAAEIDDVVAYLVSLKGAPVRP